jgi:hypothetical protein
LSKDEENYNNITIDLRWPTILAPLFVAPLHAQIFGFYPKSIGKPQTVAGNGKNPSTAKIITKVALSLG